MLKAIFFDCFGTVFDMSGIPKDEIKAYVAHVKAPTYSPLTLPASWMDMKPHPDSVEGLNRLREAGYQVVALSNAPSDFMMRLCVRNGVPFDDYVPLEDLRKFKPNPICYAWAAGWLDESIEDCLMVTANKDFGDIEGAQSVGMAARWIDRKRETNNLAHTIIDLANDLASEERP